MTFVMEANIVVGHEHIDHYGHVNYKALPALVEPEQDRFMEIHVISFDEILQRFGLRSFVRHISVDYNGEIKEGDVVNLLTWIYKLGRTSITYKQALLKDESNVAEYEMVVVLVDKLGRPSRIPEELRTLLERIA